MLQDASISLQDLRIPGLDNNDHDLVQLLAQHETARIGTQDVAGGRLQLGPAVKMACEAMSLSGVGTVNSGSVGSTSEGSTGPGVSDTNHGDGGESKDDMMDTESGGTCGGVEEAGGSTVNEEEDSASACPTTMQAVRVSITRAITTMCCLYIFSNFSAAELSSYFIGKGNLEELRSLSWIM